MHLLCDMTSRGNTDDDLECRNTMCAIAKKQKKPCAKEPPLTKTEWKAHVKTMSSSATAEQRITSSEFTRHVHHNDDHEAYGVLSLTQPILKQISSSYQL